jgi:ABC-type transport system involved in cytochrome c biogenesis permease subunit
MSEHWPPKSWPELMIMLIALIVVFGFIIRGLQVMEFPFFMTVMAAIIFCCIVIYTIDSSLNYVEE